MKMGRYYILKRYKPVLAATLHAQANMTGIVRAGHLLRIPRIVYYIKNNVANMIRWQSDVDRYMNVLSRLILRRPSLVNSLMRQGLKLNARTDRLISQVLHTNLRMLTTNQLRQLLNGFEVVIPLMWLQSTFIPYYVGDVPGFEKRLDQRLIKKLRFRTIADEAIPALIKLSREILRRVNVRTHHPESATLTELYSSLAGHGPIASALDRRYKGCFISVQRGKFSITTGLTADRLGKKYLSSHTSVAVLHGVSAYRGKVRGAAFVAEHAGDLNNIKGKHILITAMTTPDYVPYLSKVVAIVTDEGGITCHAAIVARELKIPCVIGTKVATKVLKDGDRVEVDAVHGIIKKL